MPHLYFALDLKDDPALIAEYEYWHRPENIWPEIVASIAAAGIRNLDIFRAGNRLVLVMDVPDEFDAQSKALSDAANPRIQAWEEFMWRFQQALPFAESGEKWTSMTSIFSLQEAQAALEKPA
jgi:L-rhamnose mutarotase